MIPINAFFLLFRFSENPNIKPAMFKPNAIMIINAKIGVCSSVMPILFQKVAVIKVKLNTIMLIINSLNVFNVKS